MLSLVSVDQSMIPSIQKYSEEFAYPLIMLILESETCVVPSTTAVPHLLSFYQRQS